MLLVAVVRDPIPQPAAPADQHLLVHQMEHDNTQSTTKGAASLKHTSKQNSYQLLESTSTSATAETVGLAGAEKDPEVAG